MFSQGQSNTLSSKLALLTMLFVILVQFIILVPTLSGYRERWLEDRLNSARTAALALEAAPQGMIPKQLAEDLLMSLELNTVVLKRAGTRRLLAVTELPLSVDATTDLRHSMQLKNVIETFHTLFGKDRVIRILGDARQKDEFVEITMQEKPLKKALLAHAWTLLFWTTLLSIIVGAVLFFALNYFIVMPVRRLTRSMMLLGRNPLHPYAMKPTQRDDEIGDAEKVFHSMRQTIRNEINTRKRLSNIGLSITKISHDLRNILSTAQLLSERLQKSDDPAISGTAPRLIKTLDRAIGYCERTLLYAKDQKNSIKREWLNVADLLKEARHLSGCDENIGWHEVIEVDLKIEADGEAMLRVFTNLFKNAREAMLNANDGNLIATKDFIRIQGRRTGAVVTLEVSDTGPGIPAHKQKDIFTPFQGSNKIDGSGLGLSIISDLIEEHNGEIEFVAGTLGATFRIVLPDQAISLQSKQKAI